MSSPKVDAELHRLAGLLESVLRYHGGEGGGLRVGARALERKLGWSAGALSKILKGKVEFRFRHLFDVLEALGVPAEDFFELAYPKPSPSGTAQDLMSFLESRGRRGAPLEKPEAAISDDELDERILAALRRLSLTLAQADDPGSKS
jgi:transcriptional regulator with XRE-family HTH domain